MVPTTITQDSTSNSSGPPFRDDSTRQGLSGAPSSGNAVRNATDVSYFGLNNETVGSKLENYFDDPGLSDCDLLKLFNSQADRDPNLFDFIKRIWVVLQIPASESAAGHAFSVLQALFHRCRTGGDEKLLEAELRIRLQEI
jgi:hypothetical protein